MGPINVLLGIFAVIFFIFEVYFLAIIFMFAAVVATSVVRSSYNIMLKKMPTDWQNITETIAIGKESRFEIDSNDSISLILFYTKVLQLGKYFEIKVCEQVVLDFESKYYNDTCSIPVIFSDRFDSVHLSKNQRAGFMNKAMHFYVWCINHNFDALSSVEEAILVKRRSDEKVSDINFFKVFFSLE